MTLSHGAIVVEIDDSGFATLVLNRPDKLNTLSMATRREVAAAVDALEADPAIRVLILTGAGRAFSAGLDLDEWAAPGVTAAAAYTLDVVEALRRFSGPLIGAINGLCITGGLEIALACDVLIASRAARFADSHAQVGLLPGWGGSARMVRRVGLHRAKELAFTGRFLGADEALAWGLVNRVSPEGRSVVDDALEWIRPIADGAPVAQAAALEAVDRALDTTLELGLELERVSYDRTLVSEDRREALAAFAEKRAPRFRGR